MLFKIIRCIPQLHFCLVLYLVYSDIPLLFPMLKENVCLLSDKEK